MAIDILLALERRACEIVIVEPATRRALTGAELLAEIRVAQYGLATAGLEAGDFVGLHMSRSVDQVALLFAAWQLGAAFVPLDKTLPEARLGMLIADTDLRLVVSDDPTGLGTTDPARIVSPTSLRALAADADIQITTSTIRNSDPAYLMYTSGSTGKPKGVCTSHANLAAFLDSWNSVVDPRHRGTWLAATTLSFDPAIVELVWTLINTSVVILAPSYGSATSLGSLIKEHGVTHFQCTPSRAKVLLADPTESEALGRIDHLLIGGEVLSAGLTKQLFQTGLKRITNIYGPTETTVWSFAHRVEAEAADPIPIGSALPGIRHRISTDDQTDDQTDSNHTVGLSQPTLGELIIGGPSVGSYINEVGIPSPFFSELDDSGETTRWYRTGDLVSEAANGVLTFHGRKDNQVKVNGVRIELSEVETALETQPDVREAIAAVVKQPSGADHLIAWVVRDTTIESTTAGQPDPLRERIRHILPRALVPWMIIEVAAFPLTATGKADRNRLVKDYESPLVDQRKTGSLELAYPVAAALADFTRTLRGSGGGETITEDTSFFDAGGDSLAALEIVSAVHEAVGVSLPLRSLLEAPTPREFAAYVTDTVTAIRNGTPPELDDAVLVRFGMGSGQPSFYIVHGDGGNVIGFRTLASELVESFDVVGIEAIGVEPGFKPDQTFAAMVDRYANAIRADRANKPGDRLFLGGYSGGGKIAVAVAATLQAEMAVAPVALLDASVFENLPPKKADRVKAIVVSSRNRGPQSLREWVRTSVVEWRSRFETDSDPALPFAQVEFAIAQATAPRPQRQRLTNGAFLIRVLQRNPMFEVDFDWAHVVDHHVQIYWVGGRHLTMFVSPTVEQVAQAIRNGFDSDFTNP